MISDELVEAGLITCVKSCISLYLQPTIEVWGKVIFSQVSVSPLAKGALYDVTSCLGVWSYVPSWGFLCLVPGSFHEVLSPTPL